MLPIALINRRVSFIAALSLWVFLSGCLSHIDKVAPQDKMPTMKEIYEQQTGAGAADAVQQREADIRARPVINDDNLADVHPYPARIQHLFPALPNPDLYMYVKPHVVGASGAAVPAYITRFSMYERTQYAMPNEVVSQIKHPGVVFKKPESTVAKMSPTSFKNDSCQPLIMCE